jgi:hypothetical protein
MKCWNGTGGRDETPRPCKVQTTDELTGPLALGSSARERSFGGALAFHRTAAFLSQ